MKTRTAAPKIRSKQGLRGLLVTVNCGIAYIFCYNLRHILSALMPSILKSGDFTEGQLGRFGSYMLIFYACGQLVNGLLGDRLRKPQILVLLGLLVSGGCSVLFCLPVSPAVGCLLWSVIGFSLSMLWGPISRIIVETSDESRAAIYLTSVSLASTLGQFLAYILAVFAASSGSWRTFMFFGGICTMAAAVIIFLQVSRIFKKTEGRPSYEIVSNGGFLQKLGISSLIQEFHHKYFCVMLAVIMLNGMIKHGVSYWIPTYFSVRLGLGSATAAAISSAIPIISVLGVLMGLLLFRKLKNDIATLLILFIATVAAFLLGLFADFKPTVSVLGMLVGIAAMTAANNLIFSAYCLRFKSDGHVSGISGFLNSACYLASALANLIFTFTISHIGWDFTVCSWIVFAAVGAGFCFVADHLAKNEREY